MEAIQKLVDDYSDISSKLLSRGELSLHTSIVSHYRKILLLSCASYYESRIVEIVKNFAKVKSEDERLFHIINRKAIERQYHTYFDWKNRSISPFLSLFGDDCKKSLQEIIRKDDTLSKSSKDFLTLGDMRNNMVHENFLTFSIDNTFEEIIALHSSAIRFINFLEKSFN